jgi:hypothetical protein
MGKEQMETPNANVNSRRGAKKGKSMHQTNSKQRAASREGEVK